MLLVRGHVPPAASAAHAFPGTCRSADTAADLKQSEDGGLATRLTGHRQSTCSCRTRKQIWRYLPDELTDEQVVLLADIAFNRL